jgi:hypothetical protein
MERIEEERGRNQKFVAAFEEFQRICRASIDPNNKYVGCDRMRRRLLLAFILICVSGINLPPKADAIDGIATQPQVASLTSEVDQLCLKEQPPLPPPVEPTKGIWISTEEISRTLASGEAWEELKQAADDDLGTPDLSEGKNDHDVKTLAVALVYARIGGEGYRSKAAEAIMAAIGTEDGGETLELSRNLPSYVIAADLIDFKNYDAGNEEKFREWLSAVRTEDLSDHCLISTHENRPNNWGTNAGAARIAIALYLDDRTDLERAAQVFKGWLGDRDTYRGFNYDDSDGSWQVDETNPVGINPAGALKKSFRIDGALPEEMRRGGKFHWPPCQSIYPWGALQGALMQAELLHRAGYDAWEWSDRAMLRAARFLYDLDHELPNQGWWATDDDKWTVWLINYTYGTNFPTETKVRTGKNMGWTDWTHARIRSGVQPTPVTPRAIQVPIALPQVANHARLPLIMSNAVPAEPC